MTTNFVHLPPARPLQQFELNRFDMAATRDHTPNPLRPYYIPPSIGLSPDSTSAPASASHATGSRNGTATTYATSARDMFSDLDYSDYLSESSPSSAGMVKDMIDQALYRYTSVLLAQPFEVAKTILQVRNQASEDGNMPVTAAERTRRKPGDFRNATYGDVRVTAVACVGVLLIATVPFRRLRSGRTGILHFYGAVCAVLLASAISVTSTTQLGSRWLHIRFCFPNAACESLTPNLTSTS